MMCRVVVIALAACAGPNSATCPGGGVCPPGLECVVEDDRQYCVDPACGDGVLDSGESCDDGNRRSGDGCPASCAAPCGDGILDPSERCDDGNAVGGDGCADDCRALEVCGAGRVEPLEQCDDGDLANGDGCSSGCTVEKPTWSSLALAPPLVQFDAHLVNVTMNFVYDAARGRVVYIGGGRTWEWDGGLWHLRATTTRPSPALGYAGAYDPVRRRIVKFGADYSNEFPPETWEWDGVDWQQRVTIESPPATGPFACDAGRQRCVMLSVFQTWEWDGVTWTRVMTAQSPLVHGSLVYHPRHGIILIGGGGDPDRPMEMWRYDGEWTQLAPPTLPTPTRAVYGAVYHAARDSIVVRGGGGFDGTQFDTWEWDGETWHDRTQPSDLARPKASWDESRIVYDAARERTMMFTFWQEGQITDPTVDVDEVWEWDGQWRKRMDRPNAVPRAVDEGLAMTYDAGRKRLVTFGGRLSPREGAALTNDSWEWTGTSWSRLAIPTIPPAPRRDAAIAYDRSRGRVVVHGGRSASGALGDTWIFTEVWTDATPTSELADRYAHAMAFDEARRQVVLFGGLDDSSQALDDTWTWNGSGWTRALPATQPAARYGHVMAYDNAQSRVLLFGGTSATGAPLADLWAWDGTDWTQLASGVDGRTELRVRSMTFDRSRGRAVALVDDNGAQQLWEWDGSRWEQRSVTPPTGWLAYDEVRRRSAIYATTGELSYWDGTTLEPTLFDTAPENRVHAAMTADLLRGELVLFGGLPDKAPGTPPTNRTWIWDGARWRERRVAAPPARARHAMAFDATRGVTILFGGEDASGTPLADTWEWNGRAWRQLQPADSPPPAVDHAMVYDAARGHVVMLSLDVQQLWSWSWDGANWWRRLVPIPGRSQSPLAYDARRQRVVMFSGDSVGNAVDVSEVWEWDGATWTQITPASAIVPLARQGHTLVYDPARERVVLHGGRADGIVFDDTWEWDGETWTELELTSKPAARAFHAAAFDPVHRRITMFGGFDLGAFGDTWFFGHASGVVEHCPAGLDGDRDGLAGCDDPDCTARCDACGNGVCDALESCSLCTQDCGACTLCGDFRCAAADGETCTTCPGDCGVCP